MPVGSTARTTASEDWPSMTKLIVGTRRAASGDGSPMIVMSSREVR